jgi:hypothetical protein
MAGKFEKLRIGLMTPAGAGSGLNQVIAVCAAVPTFSGRSIWIRRCVDRANSPFCIDFLATAYIPESNRRGLRDSEITDLRQPCDTAIAGV